MLNCLKRMGYHKNSFVSDVIDYSLDSNADMVIIPMFDWLHLDNSARLNKPGTVGAPNWMWRMTDLAPFAGICPSVKQQLCASGRIAEE